MSNQRRTSHEPERRVVLVVLVLGVIACGDRAPSAAGSVIADAGTTATAGAGGTPGADTKVPLGGALRFSETNSRLNPAL